MNQLRVRKRMRLEGYDYSNDNCYFVTSNVQDMVCCFGEITNGKMALNEFGKIAEEQWHWLGEQYPYVVLHAFVVMPNHIHGIIEINRAAAAPVVRIGRDQPVQQGQGKIKSLSELMGAYKTTSSKKIHLAGFPQFAWKRSFYDHIIRHEIAFYNISNYIIDNPVRWKKDGVIDFSLQE
jgi:putative transposase